MDAKEEEANTVVNLWELKWFAVPLNTGANLRSGDGQVANL